jgi:hypothetical protein
MKDEMFLQANVSQSNIMYFQRMQFYEVGM